MRLHWKLEDQARAQLCAGRAGTGPRGILQGRLSRSLKMIPHKLPRNDLTLELVAVDEIRPNRFGYEVTELLLPRLHCIRINAHRQQLHSLEGQWRHQTTTIATTPFASVRLSGGGERYSLKASLEMHLDYSLLEALAKSLISTVHDARISLWPCLFERRTPCR